MSLKQPSTVAGLFAHMKAGAEQQKRARDKLKTPTALGGAATAGTGMIASTTKAQNEATEQVKGTTVQAQKDLTAGNVGTNTVSMIAGETDKAASSPDVSLVPTVEKVASGAKGDVDRVKESEKLIDFNIKTIEDKINKLDADIKNANAADAAAIDAERTRLKNILTDYQKQSTEGNIGQIAGPSALETRLSEREQLLAAEDPYLEDGTDTSIAKLSSILGPRWKSKSAASKALASQVYGKDLETLGEQAAAGLREQELSKEQSDQAIEEFSDTLSERKEEYEKSLGRQEEQLDILKKEPGELKTYTRSKIEEMFGKDTADKLFMFSSDDPNATVTDTVSSKTRTILSDTLTKQKEEKAKVQSELDTAIATKEKQFTDIEKEVFGDVDKPGAISVFKDINQQQLSGISGRLRKVEEVRTSRWRRNWDGISKDSAILKELERRALDAMKEETRLRREMETARTTKDTAKLKELLRDYRIYIQQRSREDAAMFGQLSPTARRL